MFYMSENWRLNLVNITAYAKFGPIPSFCSKMLNGNEILTIIEFHNSVVNMQILMDNIPNLDLVNVLHMQTLIKFYRFVYKILSGKMAVTKDHNCAIYLQKLTYTNPT